MTLPDIGACFSGKRSEYSSCNGTWCSAKKKIFSYLVQIGIPWTAVCDGAILMMIPYTDLKNLYIKMIKNVIAVAIFYESFYKELA